MTPQPRFASARGKKFGVFLLLLATACDGRRQAVAFIRHLDPHILALYSHAEDPHSLMGKTSAALLILPQPLQAEARRFNLSFVSRPAPLSLIISTGSWGMSYRFNPRSSCWERWEEDYVAEPRVHCVQLPKPPI